MSNEPHQHIDDETLALAEELRQAIGAFVRKVRIEAGTPGSAQSETLGYLLREGPLSTAELARLRSVKHQSMRLVLAELETAGHVSRIPDPDDGRAQKCVITEKGAALIASSRQARAGWIGHMLDAKLSPRERQTLADAAGILRRVNAET